MVNDDLFRRLNNREYKNWMKAGRCLIILKENLAPFLNLQMSAFHRDLLNQNALLRKHCASSCRPIGNMCAVCSEWKTVILSHHRQPNTTVNWDNCVPSNWGTNHWELAKAFMPRGQAKVKAADQFDIAALLNLINYCDWFHSVDLKVVREVIRHRNDLMHSPDFHVKDEWMKHYTITLRNLLRQFRHVPQMATAEQQIDEMLAADWTIYVDGLDQMDSTNADMVEADSDGCHMITADLISQWERELLQERLEELLDDADDTKIPDDDQLKCLGGFLQDNRDLSEHFSTELQTINSLRKR
ncbi:uncharacterized protein CXorf38 homolog [Sphaeramia orbicularis]|uniref:Uncharacterized protein n=1 Tax=Sphaeramia orbicularis TaxID=375764 RepID=A0A673AR02_9TELE|nr:uncharacterized protein CXorf38 homolog [Sphaeramia orbicularis]